MVLLPFDLCVSIRAMADIPAVSHQHVLRCFYLFRDVNAVHLIHKVSEGNINTASCPDKLIAVVMVIDRNKPDAEIRKDVLKVIAGFNIVSRKSGKVFHDDAGNITGAHHRHHPLKTGTVEIRPGISVIDELDRLHRSKLRLPLNELGNDAALGRNTIALIIRTGVLKR